MGEPVAHLARLRIDLRLESVLAPVRFIYKHHHIAAGGDFRKLFILGAELLDGGKNHAACLAIKQFAQLCHLLHLLRGLTEEISTAGKCGEELIVQIVPIGEHQ